MVGLPQLQGAEQLVIDTADTLAALSVAHDALIEGRDETPAVMSGAPLWARADRLLDYRRWSTLSPDEILADMISQFKKQLGPTVDCSDQSLVGQILKLHANNLAKMWESANKALIIDGNY